MIWDKVIDGTIPFTVGKVGRWWDNVNNEIDVVALDAESNNNILLGECKYGKEPVGINVLTALENKAQLVDWNKDSRTVWYAIFSASGFTVDLAALAKERNDILLFDMSNLDN